MKLYTYPYSTAYSPSMPTLEIEISRSPHSSQVITMTALVDSGSDGTLIPINLLEQIRARRVAIARMSGIYGQSRSVDLYIVHLKIGEYSLPAVRVVAVAEGSEPILGRNVLNQMIITLNGLAAVTEVQGAAGSE